MVNIHLVLLGIIYLLCSGNMLYHLVSFPYHLVTSIGIRYQSVSLSMTLHHLSYLVSPEIISTIYFLVSFSVNFSVGII